MAKTKVSDWDTTAANNTDVGNVGIAGSNSVRLGNDAIQEVMAQIAKVNGGTDAVSDTWAFADPADSTKRVRLDAGNVTAGQTRVLTAPDYDGTILTNTDAASQASMEAESGNGFVRPAVVKFSPGVAKGWCKCDTAGNNLASYNVTSVSDTGTGQATVTWDVDFSTAQYCVVASVEIAGSGYLANVANATNAGVTAVQCWNPSVGRVDPSNYFVVAFGDQ